MNDLSKTKLCTNTDTIVSFFLSFFLFFVFQLLQPHVLSLRHHIVQIHVLPVSSSLVARNTKRQQTSDSSRMKQENAVLRKVVRNGQGRRMRACRWSTVSRLRLPMAGCSGHSSVCTWSRARKAFIIPRARPLSPSHTRETEEECSLSVREKSPGTPTHDARMPRSVITDFGLLLWNCRDSD